MAGKGSNSGGRFDGSKLDRVVAEARQAREKRMLDYREQSLRIHPWVCGRCGRTFSRENLHELTVHHKDHNHDNNPSDGSNWENLCLYCHDNEHSRHIDHVRGAGYEMAQTKSEAATHNPFANLKDLLQDKK